MSEDQAMWIVLWALGAMVVIGALLPLLLPGLVRYIDRTVLQEPKAKGHGH